MNEFCLLVLFVGCSQNLRTVLHYAVAEQRLVEVKILLLAGANPDFENNVRAHNAVNDSVDNGSITAAHLRRAHSALAFPCVAQWTGLRLLFGFDALVLKGTLGTSRT